MTAIKLELSVFVAAIVEGADRAEPAVLTTPGPEGLQLPSLEFDPGEAATLERALRDWVADHFGLALGFVEQLYTFGDGARRYGDGRDAPHLVSIGYLALGDGAAAHDASLSWTRWSVFFPWEDRRGGGARFVDEAIAPALAIWAGQDERRRERARICFGLDGEPWRDELALERYELLYAARAVDEAWRDEGERPPEGAARLGASAAGDHRRILATGIGRLRGKLKYRPVLFELAPPSFTLFELQRAAEAVSGVALHKQNFRRMVERSGLIEPTGGATTRQGGRPAAEYRYAAEASWERRAAPVRFGGARRND